MVSRSNRGGSVAEIPVVLFIIFLVLTLPMINLVSIGIRYGIVVLASYQASLEAATAKTYFQNVAVNDLSAINAAQAAAQQVASRFKGVTLQSVNTRISITNTATGATTRVSSKLNNPADTATNLYMVEPQVNAQIQPLVTMRFFGMTIPGLTAPMNVSATVRKVAENPQGLNI